MKSKMNVSVLRKAAWLLLVFVVPTFALAQAPKKPAAAPPAPHAAAPAHAQAPSHPAAASHPAASHAPQSHTTPGQTTAGHTSATKPGTPAHPGATTAGHPGTGATAGKGTAPGHPGNGTTVGGKNAPGHPGAPGHPAPNSIAAKHTPPGKQVQLKSGGSANIRPNGQIRSVNKNGLQIQHGLHGGRTVVSQHNGARVVAEGKGGGYVQRNYVTRNGNTYVSRTYVVNNTSYTNVYQSYGYGGYCCYYGYAPSYYYAPAYYGWAYNPWPAPVAYGWGWGGAPWYGYYGGYFEPYPVYPSASLWLTDYIVAASLQAAYVAGAESTGKLTPPTDDVLVASMGPIPFADTSKSVALTPEVKNALAEEVKAQLAEEQTQSGKGTATASGSAKGSGASGSSASSSNSGPPPALDPKRHIFMVATELAVVADGEECALTAGDIISRVSDTPDEDRNLEVKILASKKTDCAVGKTVAVSADDLQEMHNHFREHLTGGMSELASKQGTGGLPKAPDTSKVAGEVPAPPADGSAVKALKEQQTAADQTEAEVKQEAGSGQ